MDKGRRLPVLNAMRRRRVALLRLLPVNAPRHVLVRGEAPPLIAEEKAVGAKAGSRAFRRHDPGHRLLASIGVASRSTPAPFLADVYRHEKKTSG